MKLLAKFLFLILVIFPVILVASKPSFAKDYQVQMLNSKDGQNMIFQPDFLAINPSDEIEFIPVNKGHNSQSILVPEGAENWRGKNDEKIKIKFVKSGIYLYECRNHAIMGMIGAVKVGEGGYDSKELKKFLINYQKKLAMNKIRVDNLIKHIESSEPKESASQ